MSTAVEYLKKFGNNVSAENMFLAVKARSEDVLRLGSADDCIDLAGFVAEKLQTITKANDDIYDGYQTIWYQLVFKGFVALATEDQANLLQTRLLLAIQQGIDPSQIIREYFDFGYPMTKIQEFFRTFAKYIEQNTETLGTAPVTVEGRRFLPAIRYWIADYSNFPSRVGKRGAVERLNYLNQSVNTRALTQVQKQQLLKVLKIYDEFLNPEAPVVERIRNAGISETLEAAAAAQDGLARAAQSAPVPTQAMPTAPQARPAIDIERKLQDLRTRVK